MDFGLRNKALYLSEEIRETVFVPATKRQEEYIQILSNDLGYTLAQRDIQISDILKHKFTWYNHKLSKAEASQVIGKFKEWKEDAQA